MNKIKLIARIDVIKVMLYMYVLLECFHINKIEDYACTLVS